MVDGFLQYHNKLEQEIQALFLEYPRDEKAPATQEVSDLLANSMNVSEQLNPFSKAKAQAEEVIWSYNDRSVAIVNADRERNNYNDMITKTLKLLSDGIVEQEALEDIQNSTFMKQLATIPTTLLTTKFAEQLVLQTHEAYETKMTSYNNARRTNLAMPLLTRQDEAQKTIATIDTLVNGEYLQEPLITLSNCRAKIRSAGTQPWMKQLCS